MRQLKFRAWDRRDKKWLWPYPHGFHIIGEVTVFNVLHQIAFDRVNDLEIVQYTGFKDCNGIEIYEGDIIEEFRKSRSFPEGRKSTHLIEWDDEMTLDDPWGFQVAGFCLYGGDLKVIGNKFENTELLK